ncbi:alpha-L-fucosidase [Dysgonomonas sp.]|nr:alpha-L-fucosidase [Prevotella sp.]
MKHRNILCLFFLFALFSIANSCIRHTNAPTPYGALPSPAQLEWQKMEYYMFVHFGPNTFTNKEWGDGTEDPSIFNPSDVDCRQWVETAKKAGMKGIIITAKHHDGFCLWPSKYSTHTVRESLWKDEKGDILKELSDACREGGLKFGVYLSPWDKNHPAYGTPEYNQVFANTLTEVLSNYGEVFEQWFDGANGEGPNGKKQEYDWVLFNSIVFKHQPQAVIFSDVGPGCRWMGNEAGYAGETNWSRLNIEGFAPGNSPALDTLNTGNTYGKAWVPAETDVSIRPGWFYSPNTDDKVKSVEELLDIYCASVGRNSNLLLNVPADRRGRIHPNDSIRLMEFRSAIDRMFNKNLAKGKTAKASAVRGNAKIYDAANLLDGQYDSYWATDDNVLTASVEVNLGEKTDINCIVLQEYIPLGQRVARFSIEAWNDNANTWVQLVNATTIGYKRILRFKEYKTQKIRVNILESLACPVLNNIELYNIPLEYIFATENPKIELIKEDSDLSTEKWSVLTPHIANIGEIIDGTTTTVSIGITEPVIIDLGEKCNFSGFFYTPENRVAAPNISRYNFYVSFDGKNWITLENNVMFDNIKNNPIRQNKYFHKKIEARYIKLLPLELSNSSEVYNITEVGLLK